MHFGMEIKMKDIEMNMNAFLPLRDVVFNTLRNAILKGELAPGERLMEMHLAEQLGVSRTPIREAIRKLELEGLVVMTPRKGAVVASITEEDLRDVLEVRKVLEQLAVELACVNITEEEMAKLKGAMEEFRKAIHVNDAVDIASKDEKFHDIIYRATRNNRLIQILNNLREQMYRYRFEYVKDEKVRNDLIEEHIKIISALENKDIEDGKAAIKQHIIHQEKSILENLSQKSF